jgi:hypothetical protein
MDRALRDLRARVRARRHVEGLPYHVGAEDLAQTAAEKLERRREPERLGRFLKDAPAQARRADSRTPHRMLRLDASINDDTAHTLYDFVPAAQPDVPDLIGLYDDARAALQEEARAQATLRTQLALLEPLRARQVQLRAQGWSDPQISSALREQFPSTKVSLEWRALQRWFIRWAEAQPPGVQRLVGHRALPQRGRRAGGAAALPAPTPAVAPAQRDRIAEVRKRAHRAGPLIEHMLAARMNAATRGTSFDWDLMAAEIVLQTGTTVRANEARAAYSAFRLSLPPALRSACS